MSLIAKLSVPRTQALILAGGRGERLFPLTAFRPKPAISFGGRFRIIDFTLLNCLNSEIERVAMLTQYRHEDLDCYIRQRWSELCDSGGDRSRRLVCLPPSEGKLYRGTADAVFQNLSILKSNRPEHVLILSGDHVYSMDYRELLLRHVETDADVTIATVEHPLRDAAHFGIVEVDEAWRVAGFKEKPRNPRPLPSRPDVALVNMGVYVFKTDVLTRSVTENCESAFGYDFGHHVIPSLIDSARVFAFDFRDEVEDAPRYWRDIGTIDSYYEASMELVHSKWSKDASRWPLPPAQRDYAANISGSAYVSQCVISPGVRVEQEASVEHSVLLPGVRVGPGARIRRAIIEEGVRIPADLRVGWSIEEDRKRYTISRNGVVVVSQRSETDRRIPLERALERSAAGLKWREDGARSVA